MALNKLTDEQKQKINEKVELIFKFREVFREI